MRPSDTVVDEAIGWMVRLGSERATPQDWEACRRWRESRPDHAVAWDRLQGIQARLDGLPARASSATFEQARRDGGRRRALRAVAVVLGGGAAVWFSQGLLRTGELLAQHRTGTGERRRLLLADGTVLWLDAGTAVDERFDATSRRIDLRHGRILVTTGPDTASAAYRPFTVHTDRGTVRALGTRFMVDVGDADTAVTVHEHAVEVTPAHGGAPRAVRAGEQAVFDADGVRGIRPLDPDADAWVDGLLVARDMPLGDFVARLARYRTGRLTCDPRVASLRISGLFSVADTERTLDLVEKTLPVRVARTTRWWVAIGPRT